MHISRYPRGPSCLQCLFAHMVGWLSNFIICIIYFTIQMTIFFTIQMTIFFQHPDDHLFQLSRLSSISPSRRPSFLNIQVVIYFTVQIFHLFHHTRIHLFHPYPYNREARDVHAIRRISNLDIALCSVMVGLVPNPDS